VFLVSLPGLELFLVNSYYHKLILLDWAVASFQKLSLSLSTGILLPVLLLLSLNKTRRWLTIAILRYVYRVSYLLAITCSLLWHSFFLSLCLLSIYTWRDTRFPWTSTWFDTSFHFVLHLITTLHHGHGVHNLGSWVTCATLFRRVIMTYKWPLLPLIHVYCGALAWPCTSLLSFILGVPKCDT
jgi:hypothetical protein